MKKLYHKATVHPSPPVITDHLSFLPAAILTLAAALSPEDREVLAYLIYCSSAAAPPTLANFSGNPPRRSNAMNAVAKGGAENDHSPLFSCNCFRCYTSYWVRWDESPNQQLIHEIIDEFEGWLAQSNKGGKKGKGRKEKRNKKGGSDKRSCELDRSELVSLGSNELGESESVGESSTSGGGGGGGGGEAVDKVADEEKGSVRRFVSFIGERIWGAWGQ